MNVNVLTYIDNQVNESSRNKLGLSLSLSHGLSDRARDRDREWLVHAHPTLCLSTVTGTDNSFGWSKLTTAPPPTLSKSPMATSNLSHLAINSETRKPPSQWLDTEVSQLTNGLEVPKITSAGPLTWLRSWFVYFELWLWVWVWVTGFLVDSRSPRLLVLCH